jgi:hypothetical protein
MKTEDLAIIGFSILVVYYFFMKKDKPEESSFSMLRKRRRKGNTGGKQKERKWRDVDKGKGLWIRTYSKPDTGIDKRGYLPKRFVGESSRYKGKTKIVKPPLEFQTTWVPISGYGNKTGNFPNPPNDPRDEIMLPTGIRKKRAGYTRKQDLYNSSGYRGRRTLRATGNECPCPKGGNSECCDGYCVVPGSCLRDSSYKRNYDTRLSVFSGYKGIPSPNYGLVNMPLDNAQIAFGPDTTD